MPTYIVCGIMVEYKMVPLFFPIYLIWHFIIDHITMIVLQSFFEKIIVTGSARNVLGLHCTDAIIEIYYRKSLL